MSDEYSRYDEYKMLIEDTARFADRRQNASTLYTSINTIFLAALSIIISDFRDIGSTSIYALLASCVMIVAGILTSISWRNYILNYKKLIQLRFEVLKEMEESKGMEESIKVYKREDDLYDKEHEDGLFAVIEKKLPETFIGIYVFALLIVLVSAAVGFVRFLVTLF